METLLAIFLMAFSLGEATAKSVKKSPKREFHIGVPAENIALDPRKIQDQSSLLVARQVNCQLSRMVAGRMTLELAESLKWKTPTTLEVRIKEGVRFHSGEQVAAKDVVASLKFTMENRNVIRNAFSFIKDLRVVDKDRLEIELKETNGRFTKLLSTANYAVFSEEFIRRAKLDAGLWSKPNGCGPYRISSVAKYQIGLEAVGRRYPDLNIHLGFLEGEGHPKKKDLDFFTQSSVSPSKFIRKNYLPLRIPDPYQIFIVLNTKSKFWTKKEKRCDFFNSLDVASFYKAFGPHATIADDFYPRGVLGYIKGSWKQALAVNTNTRKLGIRLTILAVSVPRALSGLYEKLVFGSHRHASAVTFESDTANFADKFRLGGDVLVFGLKSNTADGYDYLLALKEKGANASNYWDKKLIAMIDKSQKIESRSKRAKLYNEISKQIQKVCVVKPLITLPNKVIWVKKGVRAPGLGTTSFNEYFFGDVTK
jgi:ABC-type transport system substrate-binding protein